MNRVRRTGETCFSITCSSLHRGASLHTAEPVTHSVGLMTLVLAAETAASNVPVCQG